MSGSIGDRALRPTFWFALQFALVAGCGGSESSDDLARTCEPGATRTCVGPGACDGGQRCSADGRIWGDCDCGGFDGADASAGTGGMGGSGGEPTDAGTAGASSKCPQGRGPAMIDVGAFCIDSTKVTQKQYLEFLDNLNGTVPLQSGECAANAELVAPDPCSTGDNHPVVCRDWCDAQAYCKWAGKHLCGKIGGGPVASDKFATPSESEWVFACSQAGTAKFPWGNTNANMCECSGVACSQDVMSVSTCRGGAAPYDQIWDQGRYPAEWVNSCHLGVCWVAGGIPCSQPLKYESRTTISSLIGFRCCADHIKN